MNSESRERREQCNVSEANIGKCKEQQYGQLKLMLPKLMKNEDRKASMNLIWLLRGAGYISQLKPS